MRSVTTSHATTSSRKVLVLDNSPDLLELSRILLSAEGYARLTAGETVEV